MIKYYIENDKLTYFLWGVMSLEKAIKSGAKIQAVARASEILKCFLDSPSLGITEIAQRVGLHKSTAFGITSTLVNCGFLQHDPVSGKYSIGIEAFRLGQLYHMDVEQIIRPFLNSLMGEFQETVNYVVPDGDSIVYIEKVESPHSMRISTSRGLRRPMYCTGAGKAILAFLSDEDRGRIIKDIQFIKATEHTISNQESLLEELQVIRQQGYAVDNEEYEYGLLCIAAPLLNSNSLPFGAISISGPKIRMTHETCEKMVERLQLSSSEISRALIGIKI